MRLTRILVLSAILIALLSLLCACEMLNDAFGMTATTEPTVTTTTEPTVTTTTEPAATTTEPTATTPPCDTHTWDNGHILLHPTCSSDGRTMYTCTACGTTRSLTIPATGEHTFSDAWSYDEVYHGHTTICGCDGFISDKAEHTFGEWWTHTPAGCGTDGLSTRTCTVCGVPQNKPIPATGEHTFSSTWSHDGTHHWHAATCGCEDLTSERAAHTIEGEVCTVCGSEYYSTGLSFVLNAEKNGYTVKRGTCTDSVVIIPSRYNGLPVTAIGERANFSGMSEIVIPRTVISIGELAFDCDMLTAFSIDAQNPAFCAINGDLYTKDGKTLLLYAHGKPETHVTLPAGIEAIAESAFEGCYRIEGITLPGGLKSIGTRAFRYCTALRSIAIPESVASIGGGAFYGCTSLTTVTLPSTLDAIPMALFEECAALTAITLPDGLTEIGKHAFAATGLTSIAIPKSIKALGSYAFSDCEDLATVTFAEGIAIDTIAPYAFEGCTSLSTFTLPHSVKSIGERAFSGCTSLSSSPLSKAVKSIGAYAFAGCKSLKALTPLEDGSLETIGAYAFFGCSALTEITIPSTVTAIGPCALAGCKPERITIPFVGLSASGTGCLGSLFGTSTGASNANAYVPDTLKTVVITGGTKIAERAFHGCYSLLEVYIPASTTEIEGYAFSACGALTIYVEASSIPNGWEYRWNDNGCPVVLDYRNNETATDGAVYTVIDGIRYALKDGCATVAAQSRTIKAAIIPSAITYKERSYPVTAIAKAAFQSCKQLEAAVLPEGINAIPAYTFEDCTALKQIVIPEGIVTIDYAAFNDCQTLKEITLPASVSSIGYLAFMNCVSLSRVTIGEGSALVSIGQRAFENCSSLTAFVIPSGITEIEYRTFFGCTSLQTVTFADTSGWYLEGGITNVSNPITNARNLRGNFSGARWYKQ